MKKLSIVFLTILSSTLLFSQIKNEADIVDIAQLDDSVSIVNQTLIFVDSNKYADINIIKEQVFSPLNASTFLKYVPSTLISYDFYYQFSLKSTNSFTDTVYLNPGYLVRNVKLFIKDSTGNITPCLETINIDGFIGLQLKANTVKNFLIKLSLAKNSSISLFPQIINKNYLPKYKTILYNEEVELKACGYILSGILLLMFLFTTTNYIVSGKKEFLYYCAYTFCMLCLIFLKAAFRKTIADFTVFFVCYLDCILLTTGMIFYIAFTRFFLDTKRNYKTLDKVLKFEEWMLFSLLIIYTILHYFTNLFWLENFIENSIKFIALALGIVYIILALRKKDRYTSYLAYGNVVMIIFSIVSWSLILITNKSNGLFSSPLFYYNIGLGISLIFFLFGLTYKNTSELIEKTQQETALKQEVEKKEFENQLAIIKAQQEERNRISADMHDDLGAGVTSIRLYSELAKSKTGNIIITEVDKISSLADELLNKMNAIIWSMSSSYDTLENLVIYIRSYALEYFENTGIDCRVIFPDNLPHLQVTGQVRRNFFLVIKETLNNILKHSKASKVEIVFRYQSDKLELNIHDNGVGIDLNNIRQFGNGLQNIKKRMQSIGIEFLIENRNGTLVTLKGKINA